MGAVGRKDCRAEIGKLPAKGQIANALPHAPLTVSMVTAQLGHCGGAAALDGTYMNGRGFVPVKLY